MPEKLKPCPFCGGEARVSDAGTFVICVGCDVRMPLGSAAMEAARNEVKYKPSLEAWNRRTKQAGWIKTSEQMPEAYNPVLLYHRLYKEICIGYWRARTGLWWIFNYGAYSDKDVITHWMPLPELPEEVEERNHLSKLSE